MSTRYIWGKYTRDTDTIWDYEQVDSYTTLASYQIASITEGSFFTLGSSYKFSSSGTYSLSSTSNQMASSGTTYSGYYLNSSSEMYYSRNWQLSGYLTGTSVEKHVPSYEKVGTTIYVKGDFLKYISNSLSSAYPSNSYSGSYWYVKEGSDNIDIKSIILPEEINDGTSIQIEIIPSDQKIYTGTVSQQYQYKFNDGNQTNLGSTTTLTAQNLEIPLNTTSIQIRVRAQDDLGFISNTWVESEIKEVIVNQKPTAPSPIIVDNVYINQHLYVTISESIDTDGEVIGYTIERSIDGGAFTPVISNTQELIFSEIVDPEWGTVAYRAYSTDDKGLNSDYTISKTITVNPGWVIISGPQNDLGEQPGPFNLDLMFDVSGIPDEEGIHVKCIMDNRYNIFDFSLNIKEIVRIYLNTKYLATGEHKLEIFADKEEYMSVTANYTFKVPNIDIDLMANAIAEIPQNPEGRPIAWVGLAQCIYGPDGRDVIQIAGDGLKLSQGNYVGTGTSGQSAKNTIVTGFKAKIVTLYKIDNSSSIVINIPAENTGTIQGITFESTDTEFSWYAASANEQFNEESVQYGYFILG